jgi:predicted nucleic acid-binding protein
MSRVVDTCILIDILEDDPDFGRASALCLSRYVSDGLVICPVSMIELSPAFGGDFLRQKEFLSLCGVSYDQEFDAADVMRSHQAWNDYIQKKRLHKTPKRPVADLMIGAFSTRFEGLITRNQKDFKPWFPELKLVAPRVKTGKH